MKIALMGCSGSGKSTLAARLESQLGYPWIELDSYFHQANWQPKDSQVFKDEIEGILKESEETAGGWIVDGNYLSKLDELVVTQADTVIWFHLPKRIVMYRTIKRSLLRALTRKELWNGNRESFRNLLRRSPERNIIRWSWTQYDGYVETLSALAKNAPADQRWIEIKRLAKSALKDPSRILQ
jgi:adenylate kinase family enzyme